MSSAVDFGCKEVKHPLVGDPMWRVVDFSLVFASPPIRIADLVNAFISEYPRDDYTLSFYDFLTERAVEAPYDLRVEHFGRLVEVVFHIEKGAPFEWVGLNSLSNSYVVGMPFTRGRTTTESMQEIVSCW